MQMQISIALLNARLHQSLHDAKERNESLVRVSLVINSELDLHNLLQKVMKEARELLGADRCSMYVCDHAKGELWSSVADGYHGVIRMPIGQGIAGKCAQTGEIINVKNAETDERMLRKSAYEVKNMLLCPRALRVT